MAIFPTQKQLYLLIQRELPEDVYPHAGDPSIYMSTAESASTAQMIRKVYERLQQAYDNQWPQHANVEGIELHEIARFGYLSPSLSLSERQDQLLGKMRALPSMSDPDLLSLIRGFLPPDPVTPFASSRVAAAIISNGFTQEETTLRVETYRWNYPGNTWRLGESLLGVDTILGGGMRAVAGVDICDLDPADLGLTYAQLLDYRSNAYTYEVRIYDGDINEDVTAEMLATIETELTAAEPARSQHYTYSGLRTALATLERLPSTSLHLIADNWDGGATWYDESDAGNNATRVGTPVRALSDQFYQRYSISAPAGAGFYAAGDVLDSLTERTYEIVIDDFGVSNVGHILGRVTNTGSQHVFWLYKNSNTGLVSAVWPSDGFGSGFDHLYMGGGYFENDGGIAGTTPHWSFPLIFHVVVDAPNRTIDIWRNGVQLLQASDPLVGSLGTLATPKLGIFGRYNTTDNTFDSDQFTGKILEVARHEELFTEEMIVARAAEFNRLRGF